MNAVKNKPNSVPLHEHAILMSEIFKALDDPTRVEIMLLLRSGEKCVCYLSEETGQSQSAISHHMRILRTSHLVKHEKRGKHVYYSLDDEHIFNILGNCSEHILEHFS